MITRRSLLVGSFAAAAIAMRPRCGHAQLAVICPDCSQAVQQLVDYALQIKAEITREFQLVQEITTAISEVQQLVTLPFQVYNTITNDVAAIQNIANVGSLLAGNSGSIISRLSSISSVGGLLQGTAYQVGAIPDQMAMWSNTLGNSATALGNLVSTQRGLLAGYSATAQTIAGHSLGLDSTVAAGQTAVEIARNNGDILLHIATTDQAMAEALHTTNAIAADRSAAEDGETLRFIQGDPVPHTGQPGF